MSNLGIENLSPTFQVDDMMSAPGSVSEKRATKVMAQEGMSTASEADLSGSFLGKLKESIESANKHQIDADSAIKELMAGRSKNVHETVLALEQADLSLRMMMQVRNKVLDAYREIMRMQI